MDHVALEPTAADLRASYKNKSNAQLARALWPLLSFGTYDRCAAHRWALKLISSDPQNGREARLCLANFDSMIAEAAVAYETNAHERQRYDRVYAAYRAWFNN